MNDSNLVESELRKWKLRRPSERVRESVFGERVVRNESVMGFRLSEFLRWLVPVMGCFLLVVVSLSPRPNHANDNTDAKLAFNDPNTEQNALPHTTFEWTFGARSSSSMASFTDFKTNTLKH